MRSNRPLYTAEEGFDQSDEGHGRNPDMRSPEEQRSETQSISDERVAPAGDTELIFSSTTRRKEAQRASRLPWRCYETK